MVLSIFSVESSSLLFLLTTAGIHGHHQGFAKLVIFVTSGLLSDVLDVIQVFKDLLLHENLDIKIVVDIKSEGSDALQLSLPLIVSLNDLHLKLLLFILGPLLWISPILR